MKIELAVHHVDIDDLTDISQIDISFVTLSLRTNRCTARKINKWRESVKFLDVVKGSPMTTSVRWEKYTK